MKLFGYRILKESVLVAMLSKARRDVMVVPNRMISILLRKLGKKE